MNKVIAWVKANLAIVICGAIVVLAPAVSYVVSSGMNSAVRSSIESRVRGSWDDLVRGDTTTYTIPASLPGGQPISQTGPLSNASLRVLEQRLSTLRGSSDRLYGSLLEANRANRRPIIPGVFPEPEDTVRQVKPIDFADAYPRAHEELLRIINAGSPPDSDIVLDALSDLRSTYLVSLGRTEENPNLSEEEMQELRQRLRQRRLELYLDQAQRLSVYATPAAFVLGAVGGQGAPRLSLADCYRLQEEYWVRQSLLKSLAAANTSDDGRLLSIIDAPVKRLLRLVVDPPHAQTQRRAMGAGDPLAGAEPIDPSIPLEQDFSSSFTGRRPSTGLYDLRTARMTIHVESSRLPQVLRAISTTDLIAVTNVTVSRIDPWTELNQGYLYGQSHVVEATIEVECLLLRQWTAEYMPPSVRAARGVPDPEPEVTDLEG